MTFREKLQAHKGGLLRLKTSLNWFGGCGRDNNPGRVCLIMDAGTTGNHAACTRQATKPTYDTASGASALLLIDGQLQWIFVAEADVEVV